MKHSYVWHSKEVMPVLVVILLSLVFCWGCQKDTITNSNSPQETIVPLAKIFDLSSMSPAKIAKIEKARKRFLDSYREANRKFKELIEEKRSKKDYKKENLMQIAQEAPMPEITEEEAYTVYYPCNNPTRDYILEAYDIDLNQELDPSSGGVRISWSSCVN